VLSNIRLQDLARQFGMAFVRPLLKLLDGRPSPSIHAGRASPGQNQFDLFIVQEALAPVSVFGQQFSWESVGQRSVLLGRIHYFVGKLDGPLQMLRLYPQRELIRTLVDIDLERRYRAAVLDPPQAETRLLIKAPRHALSGGMCVAPQRLGRFRHYLLEAGQLR